jgi:uncharacterized membrane protein YhfC
VMYGLGWAAIESVLLSSHTMHMHQSHSPFLLNLAIPILARLSAVVIQSALSVIVLQSLPPGSPRRLIYAIVYHSSADVTSLFARRVTGTIISLMMVDLSWGILGMAVLFFSRPQSRCYVPSVR